MNPKVLFTILGLIVICVASAGMLGSVVAPRQIDPSRDSINMVQPYGWMPQRDAHYAQEVNVPNSEANANNGQANVYNAQATQIVNQSYQQTQLDGRRDWGMGAAAGLCGSVILMTLIGGPILFLILRAAGA
jgi:hypothetical protein